MSSEIASSKRIPAYSEFFYGDIYNSPSKTASRDKPLSVHLRTFFQDEKMLQSLLREISVNQRILQMGVTFGPEIEEVAYKAGGMSGYDIIDVNELQLKMCRKKLGAVCPFIRFIRANAATFKDSAKYDVVIVWFLLKEMPIVTKTKTINNALNLVRPGGKVVFVDYHNPVKWHPLRYLVRMYNHLYHPFAEKLWDRQIDTFAKDKTLFSWRKSLFFGGMYQKVVATRKINPLNLNIVEAEPKVKEDFLQSFYARK